MCSCRPTWSHFTVSAAAYSRDYLHQALPHPSSWGICHPNCILVVLGTGTVSIKYNNGRGGGIFTGNYILFFLVCSTKWCYFRTCQAVKSLHMSNSLRGKPLRHANKLNHGRYACATRPGSARYTQTKRSGPRETPRLRQEFTEITIKACGESTNTSTVVLKFGQSSLLSF